ncbi:MAG: putative DNA binding domain-containing protein, partial [Candidatus Micrarchaeota archaeon]|nr:putative DNA binding domain-containing protein [Candidatus Micrarchaeota archaeon]
MSNIFIIPKSINDWSIETIDKIVELKYPEADNLEFKEKIPEGFEKDLCGIANSEGGFIVIGISGKDKAEEKKGILILEEHK